VPKEEFKENMAAVLSSLQEAMPSAKIILITPGRINKELRGASLDPSATRRRRSRGSAL